MSRVISTLVEIVISLVEGCESWRVKKILDHGGGCAPYKLPVTSSRGGKGFSEGRYNLVSFGSVDWTSQGRAPKGPFCSLLVVV